MTTALRVLGWTSEGLRCPDHDLNFVSPDGTVYPVTLVQMPNGTGKTTTLRLLRAAFSGVADVWTPSEVAQYRRKGNSEGKGRFQARLLHNDRRLTVTLDFDFADGHVTTKTTLPTGMRPGFAPPSDLRRFFRQEFVSLFVFDGELAKHLLSAEHTNAESAVEDLFQLRVFEHMAQRVDEYWQRQTEGKGATEEKGLARRRNRVARLKELLTARRATRRDVERQLADVRASKERLERQFRQELAKREEVRAKLSEAEKALAEATAEVRASAMAVLDGARNPAGLSSVFGSELGEFKRRLDRVKLPESAAREFFSELAEETLCVCGRTIDAEARRVILQRASQYLGSEDVSLLNAIKSDIASLVGGAPEDLETELQRKLGELRLRTRREGERRTERDNVLDDTVRESPELEGVRRDIEDYGRKDADLSAELQRYDDGTDTANDDDVFGIKVLERRLRDAEEKLAEITETRDLKLRCDVLSSILTTAQAESRRRLSDALCQDANGRIARLMPQNRIRIAEVRKCLRLREQEGGSSGETLCVAYAFLTTLFNRSDHTLPFIVDSPANPIDLEIRPEVARLIPVLGQQFIGFTISTERQNFLEPLEKAASRPLQYITVFRRGNSAAEAKASAMGGVTQTADGIVAVGRDFFRTFQIEREEA